MIVLYYLIAGVIIGSVIGMSGYFGIIPKGFIDAVPPVAIILIVLVFDMVFVWAVIRRIIDKKIEKNGESTEGIIKSVREIPHPEQITADEWLRKSRYACIVSYRSGNREYVTEFPPTCLISRRELYPIEFEEGNKIRIKYLKKYPKLAIISDDKLRAGYKAEQGNKMIHLIMIPLTVTALLITAIIVLL